MSIWGENFAPSTDRLVYAVRQILLSVLNTAQAESECLAALSTYNADLIYVLALSDSGHGGTVQLDWPHGSVYIFPVGRAWRQIMCPLTVSLHCGNEVSVQEEVHIGEVGGGSSVHHHLVQDLKHNTGNTHPQVNSC